MDNNVVVFPKHKKNTAPQSLEEIRESVDTVRREHAEALIEEFMTYLTHRAYDEGFDLTQSHTYKVVFFVMDAARAALYKTKEMEHPLHAVAERMIEDGRVAEAFSSDDDGDEKS